jgi:hypothetical protein
MRLIVADTSPLYYLLLIAQIAPQIDLLPRLFETVFVLTPSTRNFFIPPHRLVFVSGPPILLFGWRSRP